MTLYILSVVSAFSILIAAIGGLIRLKVIDRSYQPFIAICVLSLLTEVISTFSIHYYHSNAISYNLYALAECILYMFLFRNWGEFNRNNRTFTILIIFLSALWTADNFILHSIFTINMLFWIIYSFTLIFIAINQMNRLIVTVRGVILRESRFLISISIVIFYSYFVTLQIFYLFKLDFSNIFYDRIQLAQEIINFIINLIFALAILWIPRRQKFILPFS